MEPGRRCHVGIIQPETTNYDFVRSDPKTDGLAIVQAGFYMLLSPGIAISTVFLQTRNSTDEQTAALSIIESGL